MLVDHLLVNHKVPTLRVEVQESPPNLALWEGFVDCCLGAILHRFARSSDPHRPSFACIDGHSHDLRKLLDDVPRNNTSLMIRRPKPKIVMHAVKQLSLRRLIDAKVHAEEDSLPEYFTDRVRRRHASPPQT